MATRNTRRPERGYRTPGVVNDNLARKLDSQELERRERRLENSGQMDFDQYYRPQQLTESQRRAQHRAKVKASVRPAQPVPMAAILGGLCVAALMVALLMCYVRINAISRSIVAMKTQITQLEVDRVSLLTRHEQAFDLSTVKAAAEAAGMTQPSDSQVFYIRLPGEDQATSHAARSGLGGFFAAFQQRIYTPPSYFR